MKKLSIVATICAGVLSLSNIVYAEDVYCPKSVTVTLAKPGSHVICEGTYTVAPGTDASGIIPNTDGLEIGGPEGGICPAGIYTFSGAQYDSSGQEPTSCGYQTNDNYSVGLLIPNYSDFKPDLASGNGWTQPNPDQYPTYYVCSSAEGSCGFTATS